MFAINDQFPIVYRNLQQLKLLSGVKGILLLIIHCKWHLSRKSGYPRRRGSQEGYQPQCQSQQGSAWIHRFLRGGGEIFSLMPKPDANPFIILCTFAIINIYHKSSGLFVASGCAKRRQPQTEAVLDIIIGYGVVGRDSRRGDTTTMPQSNISCNDF